MLDTTEQLSKAIDSGHQAKVKEAGPKLEDQWSSFYIQVQWADVIYITQRATNGVKTVL